MKRALLAPEFVGEEANHPMTLGWSTPGRRQWPFGSATTVPTTRAQRHTIRASYRAMRAVGPARDARMALVRLLNLGAHEETRAGHPHPREAVAS